MEYDIDITPRTVFPVASLSKQFTAFALLLLESQGRLSLDDDIRKHLPDMPDFGKPVTIRNLLQHTSGLRDQWEMLAMAGWRMDDVITADNVLDMTLNQRELNFEPGAEHMYSNTGYTLGAEIIARVTGKTFRDWTRTHIFIPLGMRNTQFIEDHEQIIVNAACSYYRDKHGRLKRSLLNDSVAGAAGLFTTADDMARWMLNLSQPDLGDLNMINRMWTQGRLDNGRKIDYGLGFTTGNFRGLPVAAHGGSDASYRCYMLYFPEQRFGVVVLSNYSLFASQRLAGEAAEICLGSKMTPPVPKATPRFRREVRPEPGTFAGYVGSYRLEKGDLVTLSQEGDHLFIEADGQPGVEIFPESRYHYFVKSADIQVRFEPQTIHSASPAQRLFLTVGGKVREGVRIEKTILTERLFADYCGEYFSPELGAHYTIVRRSGKLTALHQRHGRIALEPGLPDEFIGERWFFHYLSFRRNQTGRVDGFRLSGNRVRNILFRKLS